MGKIVAKIVLTGGPCAGKTSALSKIEEIFTEKGYKVLVVGESATEIIKGGIRPFGINAIDMYSFQDIILMYQYQKEKIYEEAVTKMDDDTKCIIVYDRGMNDNKAYINQKQFTELLKKHNLNELELLDNYDMVLHLVTAADGAENFYTLGNNTARTETISEARQLDNKTVNAWAGHSNLKIISNEVNFEEKMTKVINEINNLLGEPVTIKTQKKYLIDLDKTDLSFLNEDNSTDIQIIQHYLNEKNGLETRLRARKFEQQESYYLTVQIKEKNGKATVLTDKKITKKEYNRLLETHPDACTITKIRKSFTLNKQYYRLDIFDGFAILEVEPTIENEKVEIPDNFVIIKEVTDDPYYDNRVMAGLSKSNKQKTLIKP